MNHGQKLQLTYPLHEQSLSVTVFPEYLTLVKDLHGWPAMYSKNKFVLHCELLTESMHGWGALENSVTGYKKALDPEQ